MIFWTASNNQNCSYLELLETIKKEKKISNECYKDILENNFLDILLDLIDYFEGKNVYNINYSNKELEIKVNNEERREELIEYAKKILGDNRVIISGLINGEINKDLKKINKDLKKIDKETEIWKKEFGNANYYIEYINVILTYLKQKKLKNIFFETLCEKGFILDLQNTEHILGGENYNKSIINYKNLLNTYGIPLNQIINDISIIKNI